MTKEAEPGPEAVAREDEAPAVEQPTGWAPARSRRNIVIAVVAIVIGALVALYAWGPVSYTHLTLPTIPLV